MAFVLIYFFFKITNLRFSITCFLYTFFSVLGIWYLTISKYHLPLKDCPKDIKKDKYNETLAVLDEYFKLFVIIFLVILL